MMLNEGRVEIRRWNKPAYHQALAEVEATLLEYDAHRLRKGKKTGSWISIQTYMVNGVKLGDQ